MTFRTITSKYETVCRRCSGPVAAGERVRWAKGRGVYHFANVCGELRDALDAEIDEAF